MEKATFAVIEHMRALYYRYCKCFKDRKLGIKKNCI